MSRASTSGRSVKRDAGQHDVSAALYGLAASVVRRGPRDMSLTSISALARLERTGPRRITDLAIAEGVTQPSMTLLVSRLERLGMVERQHDPADKRVALIALAQEGRRFLQRRRQAGALLFVNLLDQLSTEELAALEAAVPALERLVEIEESSDRPGWPGRPSR